VCKQDRRISTVCRHGPPQTCSHITLLSLTPAPVCTPRYTSGSTGKPKGVMHTTGEAAGCPMRKCTSP